MNKRDGEQVINELATELDDDDDPPICVRQNPGRGGGCGATADWDQRSKKSNQGASIMKQITDLIQKQKARIEYADEITSMQVDTNLGYLHDAQQTIKHNAHIDPELTIKQNKDWLEKEIRDTEKHLDQLHQAMQALETAQECIDSLE